MQILCAGSGYGALRERRNAEGTHELSANYAAISGGAQLFARICATPPERITSEVPATARLSWSAPRRLEGRDAGRPRARRDADGRRFPVARRAPYHPHHHTWCTNIIMQRHDNRRLCVRSI